MAEYLTVADHAWSLAYSANQAFNEMKVAEADQFRLQQIDNLAIPDVLTPDQTYDQLAAARKVASNEFNTMVAMVPPRDARPFAVKHLEQYYFNAPDIRIAPSSLKVSKLVDFDFLPETVSIQIPTSLEDRRFDQRFNDVTRDMSVSQETKRGLGICERLGATTLRCVLAVGQDKLSEVYGMSANRITGLSNLITELNPEVNYQAQTTMEDIVRLYPRFCDVPIGVLLRQTSDLKIIKIAKLDTVGDVLTSSTKTISACYVSEASDWAVRLIDAAQMFTKDYYSCLEQMASHE